MEAKEKLAKKKQAVQDEQLFANIVLNEKTFVYTKEIEGFNLTVRIKKPTLSQREFSETMYSKKYNQLLKDPDNLTTEELLEIARTRGSWSEEDESFLMEIDQQIQEKKGAISSETAEKKVKQFEDELSELRNKKFRIAMKLGRITQTSIDNRAEQAKYESLLTSCIFIVDENNKEVPLYADVKTLNNETDLKKLERILLDARSFWTGEGLLDFLQFDD